MAKSAGRKATTKKTTTEVKKYLCPHCLKEKKESDFHVSSDPRVLTGRVSVCKECIQKVALNWDENRQEYGICNKRSVMAALEYL